MEPVRWRVQHASLLHVNVFSAGFALHTTQTNPISIVLDIDVQPQDTVKISVGTWPWYRVVAFRLYPGFVRGSCAALVVLGVQTPLLFFLVRCFLVTHPPLVLRFEKKLFFLTGRVCFFSTDMKQEISFRASSHDHDPDWRSRGAQDSQSYGSWIETHSSVLFSLLSFSAMCLYSSNLAFWGLRLEAHKGSTFFFGSRQLMVAKMNGWADA